MHSDLKTSLLTALESFFGDDTARIDHARDVLTHAERLAEGRLDLDMEILLACAVLHDVGIKPSEEKYGYNNGRTQEELGPPVAAQLLQSIAFPAEKIDRVKEIIGNHHSPSKYDYPELDVLKSADWIVNRA